MDATLLVADGQSPSRGALERFFSACGFRVQTAHDALEWLGMVRSLHPDVVVADVDTPRGGAAAVVAFLRETGSESDVPAVLVVGNAPPEVLSQRTGVPESSCFQEPLRMESLLDRVGLAMALTDLRRNWPPRSNGRRLPQPNERRKGRDGSTPESLASATCRTGAFRQRRAAKPDSAGLRHDVLPTNVPRLRPPPADPGRTLGPAGLLQPLRSRTGRP